MNKVDMKDLRVYGGDLETDNDGQSAWVVQWAISDGSEEWTGRDMSSLVDKFRSLTKDNSAALYFHNLKYDLAFIKYGLFDMVNAGYQLFPIIKRGNPILVSISHPDHNGKALILRDSMKKLQGSLSSMAKLVDMKKLDGFGDFEPGWSDHVDLEDPRTWDYVKMDARIVAVAMNKLHEDGNVKSTFSGDAWNNARILLDGKAQKHLERHGYQGKWAKYFPKLDIETDTDLRRGYVGGINISQHTGLNEEGPFTHADVTSMYPAVMFYDWLPIGPPIIGHHIPNDRSLFVIKTRIKLKLKENKIPWFTFRSGGEYAREGLKFGDPIIKTQFWHDATLTNIDLILLQNWYDVDFDNSEDKIYLFKSSQGIFRPYIDKYMDMKKNSPKGSLAYQWAKLMMNSLYGRFGLNPNGEDSELIHDQKIDDLRWSSTAVTTEPDGYLPYAMFITAHARRRLLEYVQAAGPTNVIHCDTDSCIHYGGPVKGITYGHDLGQWDIESSPLRIWEGGFKRYVEQLKPVIDSTKSLHIAAAGVSNRVNDQGVPVSMSLEIYDQPEIITTDAVLGNNPYVIKSDWLRKLYRENGLDPDSANTMKLIPDRVKGGVILKERQHKLKDPLKLINMRGG